MIDAAGGSDLLSGRPVAAAASADLFWRRLARDRVALAAGLVVVFVFVACFGLEPLFEHLLGHGPDDIFPFAVDQLTLRPADVWSHVPVSPTGTGPRTLFVLGADGPLGRDEFLRLLAGGQASLEVAVGATAVSVAIGTALGAAAGYYGGRVDTVVSRLTDFVMGFPVLFLVIAFGLTISARLNAITLGGAFVPGVLTLVAVIGLFNWFYLARVVRAQVLALCVQDFVDAARMVGARDRYIIRRHILPHLVGTLTVYGSLILAATIILEAAFSIFGVGIPLPHASWGNMIGTNYGSLLAPGGQDPSVGARTVWLTTAWPTAAVVCTVLAFALLGEGIRRAFDPRGEAA